MVRIPVLAGFALVLLLPGLSMAASTSTSLRCGTPEPSPAAIAQCRSTVERFVEQHGEPIGGGEVAVAFHIVRCRGEGDLTIEQVQAQIAELNRAFSASGYRFRLDRVDRTDECDWFRMSPGSREELSAKHTLAIDPARRLNVYTCALAPYLLGWAYLPDQLPEEHFLHGVVLQYQAVPGGGFDGFELGRSAVHEVGHYLGLYHTFQNGCESPGDAVEDTPYEQSPAFGCPPGRNTCPQPGDDPVGNYMEYADDRCMTTLTPGQVERMRTVVPIYRPSLVAAPVAGREPDGTPSGAPTRSASPAAQAALASPPRGAAENRSERPGSGRGAAAGASVAGGAMTFEGASPNPFCDGTVLRFTLPKAGRVHLGLRTASGKRVRTVLSRRLEAGAHEVRFESRGLEPGIYVAELSAGGAHEKRVLVLER